MQTDGQTDEQTDRNTICRANSPFDPCSRGLHGQSADASTFLLELRRKGLSTGDEERAETWTVNAFLTN